MPSAWTSPQASAAIPIAAGILVVVLAWLLSRGTRQDRQLREAAVRDAAVVEFSNDAVITKTLDGVVTSWNRAAERIFGYPAEEVIGRSILILYPPERADEEKALVERIQRGEAVERHETVRTRKDGTLMDVSMTVSPIRDKRGKLVGTSTISRDITDRRKATEMLRQSELRYHVLFDSNPMPMWVYDLETFRFLAVNDTAIRSYGYSHEEFLAMRIHDIRPPEAMQALTEILAHPLPPFESSGIWTHRKKDGTLIQVEVAGHALEFSGRQARLVLANDVTDRRRAEEEIRQLTADLEERVRERTEKLKAANQELETFSYSVSHDLRAPLRRISGFVRIVVRDHGGALDAETQRLLGIVSKETEHMARLIDDLLAFSRASRQELESEAVDMTELARGTYRDLVAEAPEKFAWLSLDALPLARGDRAMLRQVFSNLLDNALKFSSRQDKPRISVAGWSDGKEQVYRVKDNGVGFDPRYTSKLFAVFQRLHSQDEFEGTGVGLALVQRIVARHGGRVWAESAVNAGASFYFSLPERKA